MLKNPMVASGYIGDIIDFRAKDSPDKIFFTDDESGKEISFLDFQKATNRVCNVLRRYQINPREKIAIILSNRIEWIYCNYGILKYGAISAAINPYLGCDELLLCLERGDVDHIIIEERAYEKIKSLVRENKRIKKIFGIGISDDSIIDFEAEFDDVSSNYSPEIVPQKRDISIVSFTAGLTGKPKAVQQTNRWLIEQSEELQKAFGVTSNDCFLCIQNLYYTDWTVYTTIPLIIGGKFVLTKGFSKSNFWEQIEKHSATIVNGTLAHLNILISDQLQRNEFTKEKRITSTLRLFICSGTMLSAETIKTFERLIPETTICPCYNTLEAGWISVSSFEKNKRKIESLGKVMKNISFKIVDDDGKEKKPFENGTFVVIDSPYLTPGFLNSPLETKQQLRKDGYHTDDICFVDNDDYLHLVSMGTELINRGGEKISPKNIDATILEHDMVADCKTIGVPDKIYGEEVISFVVIKYGLHATKRDIIEHCKEHLAEFKCPKNIFFIDALPKDNKGRPDIEELLNFFHDKNKEESEEKTVLIDGDHSLF